MEKGYLKAMSSIYKQSSSIPYIQVVDTQSHPDQSKKMRYNDVQVLCSICAQVVSKEKTNTVQRGVMLTRKNSSWSLLA